MTAPWHGRILLLILLSLIITVLSLWNAVFLRSLVDAAVTGDRALFGSMAARMLLMACAEILLSSLYNYRASFVTYRIQNHLQMRLFGNILHKDFPRLSEKHTGDWMNRMSVEPEGVAIMAARVLPGTLGILAQLIGATWLLLRVSIWFLPVMLFGLFFFIVLTLVSREPMLRRQREVRAAQVNTRSFFTDVISQMLVVKAFNQERLTESRGNEPQALEFEKKIRRQLTTIYKQTVQNTGFKLGLLSVVIFVARFLLDGRVSYGTFSMCFRLLSQFRDPLNSLGGYLNQIFDYLVGIERLREPESYRDDPSRPVKSDAEIREIYRDQFREIRFKDVSFSYHDHDENSLFTAPKIFSHVDMDIRKQSFTAFTGMTGSGKSTIFKLLMSLYPLNGGSKQILFADGTEVELNDAWRRLFAYVPQGNQLMTGTVREIVAFSDKEKSQDDEKIRNALRIACALEFVEKLPNGLDTQIRERGLGLSEGQVQRLAIARAIFTERPLLLLDEATSALDERTERELLEHLKDMTDRTILIVTHRPAAMEICDHEVHIDDARVTMRKLNGHKNDVQPVQ